MYDAVASRSSARDRLARRMHGNRRHGLWRNQPVDRHEEPMPIDEELGARLCRVLSLFDDDWLYLKAALQRPRDPPLPAVQVIASIKCRATECLRLIQEIESGELRPTNDQPDSGQ